MHLLKIENYIECTYERYMKYLKYQVPQYQ